jgi:hypothetical protein
MPVVKIFIALAADFRPVTLDLSKKDVLYKEQGLTALRYITHLDSFKITSYKVLLSRAITMLCHFLYARIRFVYTSVLLY